MSSSSTSLHGSTGRGSGSGCCWRRRGCGSLGNLRRSWDRGARGGPGWSNKARGSCSVSDGGGGCSWSGGANKGEGRSGAPAIGMNEPHKSLPLLGL